MRADIDVQVKCLASWYLERTHVKQIAVDGPLMIVRPEVVSGHFCTLNFVNLVFKRSDRGSHAVALILQPIQISLHGCHEVLER